MKCEHCGENEAEFNLPSTSGGQIKLCKKCYELNQSKNLSNLDMNVHNLFEGIMNLCERSPESKNVVCNSCGLTFENFRDIGRLGCSNCYVEFHEQLEPILKKLHGTTKHKGKKPVYLQDKEINEEIISLRKQLKLAIKMEEYEKAAKIRDQLKSAAGVIN